MPRRALRRIDETLDYSRHLYMVKEQLEKPWDVSRYFEDPSAPLEVEMMRHSRIRTIILLGRRSRTSMRHTVRRV